MSKLIIITQTLEEMKVHFPGVISTAIETYGSNRLLLVWNYLKNNRLERFSLIVNPSDDDNIKSAINTANRELNGI